MTNLHSDKMTMETLADLLDQFGGDTSRMPAQTAAAIEELVARSDEARDLLEQARALDDALSANRREVSWDISALESRILDTAFNGAAKQHDASIINLSDHKSLASQLADQTGKAQPESDRAPLAAANDNRWSSRLAASGLLAASLLFGVFFGAFGGANMLIGEQPGMTLASTDLSTVLADDFFELGTEYGLDATDGIGN